jgi:hypothetical protein
MSLLVGDSNNKCIYKERFKDTHLLEDAACWKVEIRDPSSVNEVHVNLISEQWVGLDVHSSIKLPSPRQTIPLEAKNSIGRYLKKQGISNDSPSSTLRTPPTEKRKHSSIVDQIREMSQKRLGSILTLNKTAERTKLLPPLGQQKNTQDMPQVHNPDRHPMEQMNPDMHRRHVKPKLMTDRETSSLSSSLRHTSTDVNQQETLLKDESINSYRDPDMQLYKFRIMKCNAGQEQHNTLSLQDGGTHHSTALQTAQTGSEYKAHTTRETNSTAQLMKLPQNKLSCDDIKLIKSSTSKPTAHSQTPLEENTELFEASILEEEEMNKNAKSKLIITLNAAGEEHPETEKSADFNSQITDSSSVHNNSLLEEYNAENNERQPCDVQKEKASKYVRVMELPSTPSPDAHCNLATDMFQANPPASSKDAAKLPNDRESKQLDLQDVGRKHGLAIVNDETSVHSTGSSVNRKQRDTNAAQSAYLLKTQERKIALFHRTLPKHYYPVFMKSLQPAITGPTELNFPVCDHLKEPSNEVAAAFLMQEKVTCNSIASESRKEPTQCGDGTWAADSEDATKKDEDIEPLPREANSSNTVQIQNEASVPKSRRSQHSSEGSLIGENRPEVHEDRRTENENSDTDSQQKDCPVPNFDLVTDIDSFLAGMFTDDGTERTYNDNNNNFMANAPTNYLDRNKFVSRGFPENSSRYVHRIIRNESKYEPILNLLLKDVSRKEIMFSSSIMEANEKYNTKELSQFQSQSQTNYVNLGAKNKRTPSHFTQGPQNCDSVKITNQNSKHISPLSNFTQTLQTHNSDQSDYCNRQYIQRKFSYQPSVLGGYTKMSSDSGCTPENINEILQTNEISRRWNDATSINIPIKQPPSFTEKKSYTHIFEFGNSLCTQPQLSPLQDDATTTAALYTPIKCTTGGTESSQWQQFQISPASSDNSPEVYY